MPRRIIQIAIEPAQIGTIHDEVEPCAYIYALCDDGTLWFRPASFRRGEEWTKVDAVPDGEQEKPR